MRPQIPAHYLKYIQLILYCIISSTAQAQLINCNVFLQGRYVEVGVNINGAFGSSEAPPAGFHPRGVIMPMRNTCTGGCTSASNSIGFVADQGRDGWAVGIPNYIGDYFMPGTPHEGWSIEVNGAQSDAWNYNAHCTGSILFTGTLTGNNVSHSTTATGQKGVWQGINGDSIEITQVTTVDTGALFFTIEVTLKNLSHLPRTNIYYLRTIDPDNDQALGGSHFTYNTIVHQRPNPLGATTVRAVGATFSAAYLAMCTFDCRAKCFILNSDLAPTMPISTLYAGAAGVTYTGTQNGDRGIGLVFNIGTLSPGAGTKLTYAYTLNQADLMAALGSTLPRWTNSQTLPTIYFTGDTSRPCPFTANTITLQDTTGSVWTWVAATGEPLSSYSGLTTTVTIGTGLTRLLAIRPGRCPGINDTINVYVRPISAPPITGPPTVCVGSTATLTATPAGGTWLSGNTSAATISGTGIVTGIAAGTSAITYTPATGCGVAVTIVTVNQPAVVGPVILCAGPGTTVTLTGTPVGGAWSSGTTGVATIGVVSGILTGMSAGTATISYLYSGCYTTVVVTVNSAGPITGTATVCVGSVTSLSAPPAGGTWASGNPARATVSTTGDVTGISPGTVIITYTANGCQAVRTVTVFAPPGPITGTPEVCAGAVTILSCTPASGTWASGATSIATVAASGVVTGVGVGTAVITYSAGTCGYSVKVVTVHPSPNIAGLSTVCAGLSTTLTGSPAGGTWLSGNTAIATVSSSGNVTGIAVGTALITYTLAGCNVVAIVTVGTPPGAITGSTTLCAGASATLSNPAPGGSWASSNPGAATISPGGLLTGIAPGTATITYSMGSCGMASVEVTINAAPAAITGSPGICISATTLLSNTVPGGLWSSSNTGVATVSPGGLITAVGGGTAIITYALGSCISSIVVTVNSSAPPITGTPHVCQGLTTMLSNSAGGGAWSSGNISIATITPASGIIHGIAPGTAVITYSLGGACISTTIVTVHPLPDPGTLTGPGTLCVGSSGTITASVPGGSWAHTNSTAVFLASGNITALQPGIDTITYTVTNGLCGASVSKIITVHPTPTPAAITGPATLCLGAQVHLTPTIGGGTWLSGNTAVAAIGSANGDVSCTGNGTTVITYTTVPDANGCTASTTFTLSVTPPLFTINAQVAHISCYGAADGSITLSVPSASTARYAWSTGALTPGIGSLAQGIYTVSVTDTATQCTRTAGYTINEPDSIILRATATADTCNAGQGIIITDATGGTAPYAYAWSSSASTTATAANLAAGPYTLTLTDANGCKDTISATVPAARCKDIVIHDVITPNGDGVNDQWVIQQIHRYPRNKVQIFDKWGDKVYEKQGYNNEWSGQATSGSNLPDGVYYYIVKLNENNHTGGENEFAGTVMIKR